MIAYFWNIEFQFGIQFGISNWIDTGLDILREMSQCACGMKCTTVHDACPSLLIRLQQTIRNPAGIGKQTQQNKSDELSSHFI